MKFYKSFLFLIFLSLFFILPFFFLLNIRFLVPVFAFLLVFYLFLLFFQDGYFKRQLSLSSFAIGDQEGISFIFEELKKTHNVKNVQLHKAKNKDYSFFCFGSPTNYFLILSEELLEDLSMEDTKRILEYYFYLIKTGDMLLLSLLSGLLFFIEKTTSLLSFPFVYFKKHKNTKTQNNLILFFLFKLLSPMTKWIFYRADKNFLAEEGEKNKFCFSLWKLDGLMTLNPPTVPSYFAPLFLTNFLTNSKWGCYISFHPSCKNRIKSLGMLYPPVRRNGI